MDFLKIVKILKSKQFEKFTKKNRISDKQLIEAVHEIENGSSDDLGGNVIKKRLPKQNKGKSGGYRAIIYYKLNEIIFFQYGFDKSDQGNINQLELKNHKKAAKKIINLTPSEIETLINSGYYIEVKNDS